MRAVQRHFELIASGIAMLIALLSAHSVSAQTSRSSGERIVVKLRAYTDITSEVVIVSQTADIECRDPKLKAFIEALDLADAPKRGSSTVVSATLIQYRLQLEGVDVRNLSIRGQQCEVKSQPQSDRSLPEGNLFRSDLLRTNSMNEPLQQDLRFSIPEEPSADPGSQSNEELIFAAARRCVLRQLPFKPEDVSIRLAQAINTEVSEIESLDSSVVTADIRGDVSPTGRVQVDVSVRGRDRVPKVIQVALEVRHFEKVIATSRLIAQGQMIAADDLYVVRRDVTGSTSHFTDPQQLIGKRARRSLSAVSVLRDSDVESTAKMPSGKSQSSVKTRDRVNLVAKVGDLRITTLAEAQQDGNIGDVIQVQNVDSKTIRQARVVGPGEVEIVDAP